MTVDLPNFLDRGEPARLIPVAHASQKERSAASVFLSALTVVRPFAESVLSTINKSVGPRTSLTAFTEVVFKDCPDGDKCRPDGLLILSTPKTEWRAVIEAKIGTGKISADQLTRYTKLAAHNKIDAVITISNELAVMPDHPPYEVPPKIGGKVEVYHWSWMRLVTLGTMLLSQADETFDPEQHFLLKEVLRYFSHENVDVRGFHQMNPEWPGLLERIQSGAELNKTDANVLKTIAAWHQEQSDLCLLLARKLRVPVSLKIKKSHRSDQTARVNADADELVATKRLSATFDVPNIAAPIEVTANALKRNIVCQMSVDAPEDKRRYESRLNWLLRQLPEETDARIGIHIRWKNGGNSFGWITDLRSNPKIADIDRQGALPKCFDVITVTDLGRKFSGTKNFIDVLETALPQFYDSIARHIRPWQPSPASGPLEGDESLADTVESLPNRKLTPRQIVKQGAAGNGHYLVFADGSIEVETPNGIRSFKSLGELLAHAKRTTPPNTPSA